MAEQQVVSAGKVVGIYYTVKNEQGTVLDTNRRGGKPMAFLHGAHNILPGLERALEGKRKDDFIEVVLAPADAYGERDEKNVKKVARSAFPAQQKIEPGMRFTGKDPVEGTVRSVLVVEVGEQEITIDESHPLAGQTLTFEVTVCGVRDATKEEHAHGHPHGPGGHHGH
jgi:FKBP-type peptidyl-prolyl cis-trans isomerase SlyD